MPISIHNSNWRALLIIASVYAIANGLMLINNGIFWDDWTLFNMSEHGIREQFIGNGSWNTGLGYLHIWLQKAPNPALLYHGITFFLHLGISLLFYGVLSKFDLDHTARLAISLIAATVPFNQARVTMICLPYSISLFLFMLAFLIFINNLRRNNILIRVISLALFFYSFITNSLLVFYAIVPLALMYFNRHQLKTTWKKLIVANIDFLILPPLFWVIKNIFLKPQNFYNENGYNSFSIKRLIYSPIKITSVIVDAFTGNAHILGQAIFSYYFSFNLVLLAGFFLFNVKFKNNIKSIQIIGKRSIIYMGLLVLTLAVLPYVLVGKLPLYQGFETRHQLLMPFGYSLLVFGLIVTLVKEKFRGLVLVLITLFNITGQINLHKQYLVGWMKQESIMSHFQQHPEIIEIHTIQVFDHTPTLNATSNPLRFYEWNGMAKKIFNRQDQLYIPTELNEELEGITLTEFTTTRKAQRVTESRNMGNYAPDGSCGLLIVKKSPSNLGAWSSILKTCFYYYLAPTNFDQYISKFITLKFDAGCPKFYPQ